MNPIMVGESVRVTCGAPVILRSLTPGHLFERGKKMKLICSHCQHTFSVTKEYADYSGNTMKCPKCKKPVEVPQLPASPIAAFVLVGIISAALAGIIGFTCGALLTRANREETEARILAIKTEANEVIKDIRQKAEGLEAQNAQLRNQLRENASEIDALSKSVREAWAEKQRSDQSDERPRSAGVRDDYSDSVAEGARPSVGERGHLHSGTELVALAVEKKVLDEWNDALFANDTFGRTELLTSGRIFVVPDGTEVLMLDSGWSIFVCKVRILEGEHLGQTGWIPVEWVTE